ncbi:MAG: hypothetical protein MI864_02390 [Pseudomonadales bacterium]|uniref:Uncharacterized protein n=1 Tax=Oleiphilus messinensis TaxID=141451 RepID=A0A1Y0I5J5_9GAMM|nr:hypothetical protein [Oleiphilus messinensis]ARU54714.1 hypothetical protein OLMES_0611 [Oleiphilus messinensis]MCG8609359.1 hypothetical protein [Pseudomonadales bacterium]
MNQINRLMFTRPLALAIIFSVGLELVNYLVFGLLANTQGANLGQFVWMVLLGGIGMGAVLGAFIDIILVGRVSGKEGIQGTVLLSCMTIGITAKLLTLNLTPLATDFGASYFPALYLVTGIATAAISGLIMGWLLFTEEGNDQLDKWKL